MDWLGELNATIELDSWFEIQSYEAKELRDFILEKDEEIERLREKNKKLIEATSAFHIAVYNALFAFDKTLDELEKVNQ